MLYTSHAFVKINSWRIIVLTKSSGKSKSTNAKTVFQVIIAIEFMMKVTDFQIQEWNCNKLKKMWPGDYKYPAKKAILIATHLKNYYSWLAHTLISYISNMYSLSQNVTKNQYVHYTVIYFFQTFRTINICNLFFQNISDQYFFFETSWKINHNVNIA